MYILIRFCLKTFLKINIFLYKNNDYSVLIAPGEMFDNMLQLMRFSDYFKGILRTDNGYFHIKIMISAAHMLRGSWACSLRKFLKKKCNLVRFDVSLHTILGLPRQVPSHAVCGPTQVRFLAS